MYGLCKFIYEGDASTDYVTNKMETYLEHVRTYKHVSLVCYFSLWNSSLSCSLMKRLRLWGFLLAQLTWPGEERGMEAWYGGEGGDEERALKERTASQLIPQRRGYIEKCLMSGGRRRRLCMVLSGTGGGSRLFYGDGGGGMLCLICLCLLEEAIWALECVCMLFFSSYASCIWTI